MIEIKITEDELTIEGHAGHDDYGKDIVCAGVSALALTLAESIRVFTDDSPPFEARTGFFKIGIKNLSEKSRLLIDSFFIGCCDIATVYPDCVKIG